MGKKNNVATVTNTNAGLDEYSGAVDQLNAKIEGEKNNIRVIQIDLLGLTNELYRLNRDGGTREEKTKLKAEKAELQNDKRVRQMCLLELKCNLHKLVTGEQLDMYEDEE